MNKKGRKKIKIKYLCIAPCLLLTTPLIASSCGKNTTQNQTTTFKSFEDEVYNRMKIEYPHIENTNAKDKDKSKIKIKISQLAFLIQ